MNLESLLRRNRESPHRDIARSAKLQLIDTYQFLRRADIDLLKTDYKSEEEKAKQLIELTGVLGSSALEYFSVGEAVRLTDVGLLSVSHDRYEFGKRKIIRPGHTTFFKAGVWYIQGTESNNLYKKSLRATEVTPDSFAEISPFTNQRATRQFLNQTPYEILIRFMDHLEKASK